MSDLHNASLLESIVTTTADDGSTHVSAMGPRVDWPIKRLLLRPFQTSTTFANLARTHRGIMHVTDDVLILARAAIGRVPSDLPLEPGPSDYPARLADCVRWYAFEVESIDDSQDRSEMVCRVTHQGCVRDFFGFNRARHAVIEAAILATRLHLTSMEAVMDRYGEFATIVEKTAGETERLAFAELQQYLNDRMGEEETRTMLDS